MQCAVLIPMAVIGHSSQNIGLPVCDSSLSWLVNWKTGRCSYIHKIVIEDVLLVSLFLERLNLIVQGLSLILLMYTAQKMKFSIKDFLSKCDQISGFLRIWSHLLKKSLMEKFIFCAVLAIFEKLIFNV